MRTKSITSLWSLLALVCLLGAQPALASTRFSSDSFDIYVGDVNGDGYDDVYLQAKEKVLILAAEISIPIAIKDSDNLLIRDAFGTPSIVVWTTAVNLASLTRMDADILIGDFNGDGISDLLLKSNDPTVDSLIVFGASGDVPTRLSVFDKIEGQTVYDRRIVVRDVNGDGRSDLQVFEDDNHSIIALASSTGAFSAAPSSAPTTGTVVGATAGDFEVGPDGSANYTIPIAVAPGGAGMQPELAFTYNSGSGNGYMGMGWDATQPSAISKCGTSFIEDGYIEADKYFCLDGNRLVDVSTSFGAASGTVFYPANADFSKVEKLDNDSFAVYYKSGEIAYFGNYQGNNPNARQTELGLFHLAHIEDRAGNAREYDYIKDTSTGEHYLTHIRYPGGEVEFKYTTGRGDPSESWHKSYRSQVLKRLSRVESRVDSTRIYRSYELGYSYTNGYDTVTIGKASRLASLTECGADGSCLMPTTFEWGAQDGLGFKSPVLTNFSTEAGTWASKPIFVDLNDDGFTDLVTSTQSKISFRLGKGDGTFGAVIESDWRFVVAGDSPTNTNSSSINLPANWQYAKVGNIDNDNQAEILIPDSATSQWYALDFGSALTWILDNYFGAMPGETWFRSKPIRNQTNNQTLNAHLQLGDFNGDGLVDFLPAAQVSSGTYRRKLFLNDPIAPFPNYDYIGQKWSRNYDPLKYYSWTVRSYLELLQWSMNQDPFELIYKNPDSGMNAFNTEPNFASQAEVIDMDGDGVDELLVPRNKRTFEVAGWLPEQSNLISTVGVFWSISKLNGNAYDQKPTSAQVYNADTVRIVDINGDGLSDIAYNRDGRWAFNINKGGDFGPSIISNATYRETSQFFDYNDDGYSDILYINGGEWFVDLFAGGAGCYTSGTNCYALGLDSNVVASAASGLFQLGEFDGDGRLDVITYNNSQWRVFLHKSGGLPTYLTKVTNGLGLQTKFNYGQLYSGVAYIANFMGTPVDPNPSGTSNPSGLYNRGSGIVGPMRVVQSVEVDKSATITNTGANAALLKDIVSYNYSQLLVHRQGLGSLGFRTVTATTPLTQTVTTYSQDWAKRTHGMAESVQVRKRATPASSWRDVSLTQNTNVSLTATQSSKIRYTFTGKTVETEYDVTATNTSTVLKRVTTEYGPDTVLSASQSNFDFSTALYNTTGLVTSTGVFDITQDFGNMVAVKVVTSNAAATESHTVLTTSRYNDENSLEWIIGRVSDTTVVSSGTGRTTKTRNSSWDYYPDGYLSSETIAPNDGYLEQTTSYTYNSFGLKETVTVSGDDVASRSSSTYYDSYGRYPVRVVNTLGTVETDYDPVLGLPTSVTDINGLTSYTNYDGFGRPRVTTNPDGTWQQTTFHAGDIGPRSGTSASSKAHYSLSSLDVATASVCSTCAERKATYVVVTQDQTGAWTETFFDLMGNEFEKRSLDRFDTSRIVATRTEYDTYGDAVRTSEPYALSTGPQYWTSVVQKDILGRPLRVRNPEGKSVSYLYAGFDTTVTNELGKTKKDTMTVDGKLGTVTDHDGNRVTYAYDGAGNMTGMTDPGTNGYTTTIVYDNRGSKTSMSDPNKGNWSYAYNAFGELILQTDAEGQKTCQAYDNLGRMTLRVDNFGGIEADARSSCSNPGSGEITRWFYDTAANGKGKLARVEGPNGFVETFEYDELGRPTSNTRVIAGQSYTTKSAYDLQSRPVVTTYPSGLSVFNVYNDKGVLTQINKSDFNVTGAYYWKLILSDHRGQPVGENMASGLMERATSYTPARGFVNSIDTGAPAGGKTAQWDLATYDELGNVKWRQNAVANSEETAGYDNLNRLRTIDRKINGVSQPTESMTYAANGNIATKWNVSGTYGYGGTCNSIKAGPHAVTSAAGNTYCYDRNGNMVSGAGRTVAWSSYGLPTEMARGTTAKAQFEYGPDRNRIRRLDYSNNVLTATTTYVGSYEKVVKGSVIEERHYIGGVAVVTKKTNGATVTVDENYLLKDNLGSVVNTVDIKKWTDEVNYPGYIGDRGGFDATGMRRNANWTVKPLSELYLFKSAVTDRGYTGHEQIDEVGLIHMNGRVYDPVLGRFISADPIIQDPTDLQSLNRYTYVRNNPLSMTDPSGFSWASKTWKKIRHAAEKLAYYVVHPGMLTKSMLREFGRFARKNKYVAEIVQIAGCAATGMAGCALVSAAVTYAVTDGDFKAAITAGAIAFITASISQGIGGSGWGIEGRVLAHGMVGGTMSVAQGGKFGAGFAGSAFGAMAGGLAQSVTNGTGFLAVAARTTVAALVGGTASKLSGGSFANGARTAAMQHLFNAEAHRVREEINRTHGVPGSFEISLEKNDGSSNTVVTDGKGGMKPYLKEVDPKTVSLFTDAATVHENFHIGDIQQYATNLGILSGAPEGLRVDVVGSRYHLESRAYAAEKMYLYENVGNYSERTQTVLLPKRMGQIDNRLSTLRNGGR